MQISDFKRWHDVLTLVQKVIHLNRQTLDAEGREPFFPRLCLAIMSGSSQPVVLWSTEAPEFATLVAHCIPSNPLWNMIKIKQDPDGLIVKHELVHLNLLHKRSSWPQT